MKKNILLLAIAAIATSLTMTSCLGDTDTSDNTYSYSNYFTIKGSYPNYKLYSDNGGIFTPSVSSVSSLTSSKGFGDYQRAYFSLTYTEGNYQAGTSTTEATINDASISSCLLIDTKQLITTEEAELQHVTDSDSIFYVSTLKEPWVVRGYLTTIINGYYVADSLGTNIEPSIALVYDTAHIEDNKINIKLYYNNHKTAKTTIAGATSLVTSWDATKLEELVPGTEDIEITITPTSGGSKQTITVPRSYLKFE